MKRHESIEWTMRIPALFRIADLACCVTEACQQIGDASDSAQAVIFGPAVRIANHTVVLHWSTGYPQEARDVLGKLWVKQGEHTSRFHPVDERPEAKLRGYARCIDDTIAPPARPACLPEYSMPDEPATATPLADAALAPAGLEMTPPSEPVAADETPAPAPTTRDGVAIVRGLPVCTNPDDGGDRNGLVVLGPGGILTNKDGQVRVRDDDGKVEWRDPDGLTASKE